MLRWRLTAAAGILVPLALVCWLDERFNFDRPGIWLTSLAAIVTLAATAEVLSLLRATDFRPTAWVVQLGALLLVASAAAALVWNSEPLDTPLARLGLTLAAITVSVVLLLINEMGRYREPGKAIVTAGLALYGMLYVGLPIAFLVHLRLLHVDRWGIIAVVSILVVVKVSDSGAYFCGRALGRRHLAPRLSPKKTVEGAIGGLLAGCLASWLFFHVTEVLYGSESDCSGKVWAWLLYGATLVVAGVLGDLSESMLKRDMRQKDSSRWLPGLGGVLDVIDSILFAAPAGYVWWATGGVGP